MKNILLGLVTLSDLYFKVKNMLWDVWRIDFLKQDLMKNPYSRGWFDIPRAQDLGVRESKWKICWDSAWGLNWQDLMKIWLVRSQKKEYRDGNFQHSSIFMVVGEQRQNILYKSKDNNFNLKYVQFEVFFSTKQISSTHPAH